MANKQDLLHGLNEDLAAELGTIIRYTYQASKSFGPMGAELRELFESEVTDEMGHASYLMDAIVDLGGEPTTAPQPFEKLDTLRGMVEQDIALEQQDVENYKRHSEMADSLGLIELKVRLEEMAADEAGHARELRRMLKGLAVN